jgi:hypothetical protein
MDPETEPQGTAAEFTSEFLGLLTDDDAAESAPVADESEDAPAAADLSAVEEEPDDEADLTPEERVAAALADEAEDDALAVADPEDPAPPEAATDADDLDDLSEEEIRQIARDALANRESDRRKRAEAIEATTVAAAQKDLDGLYQEYNVALTRVRQHYTREESRLLRELRRESERQTNPEAYYDANVDRVVANVRQHEDTYIAQNLTTPYEQRVRDRQQRIPDEVGRAMFAELKGDYVRDLTKELGLNAAAIPELMKVDDPDAILARAQELVVMRDAVLAARARDRQSQRRTARREVATTAVRPPTTGRPKAGTPRQLKGDVAEGWELLRGDLTA